ncbi:MAG: NUDIX domain-containing protein [Bryobacteraceae bacterium]
MHVRVYKTNVARFTRGPEIRLKLVVAALLRKDGQILIAQRRSDDSHALKWEFPGGKVEAGESAEEALRRELEEELGIDATVGAEVERYPFAYAGKMPITLAFFWVDQWTGEPVNRVFEQIAWAAPVDLPSFDFLEGDRDFVARLAVQG